MSVVIDLFFVCSAVVDHCLLTALAETEKTATLHTSVFVVLALSTPLWQTNPCLVMGNASPTGTAFSEKVDPDIKSVILQMQRLSSVGLKLNHSAIDSH